VRLKKRSAGSGATSGVRRLAFRHFIARRSRKLADRLERGSASAGDTNGSPDKVLDEYVLDMPSAQNALSILPGWNHALPPEFGVTGGKGAFYADTRIAWLMDQVGSLEGKRVLELGPLEAAHTYMLEQRNPASLCAIEANKLAYLRCLVVKEILNLKVARFLLGDFCEWLERTPERYDLIVASGVLYHMQDPLKLIELIAARTNAFYLWTHYVSPEAMPDNDPRRNAFQGEPEIKEHRGLPIRLYRRSYLGAWKSKSFCGGAHDLHRWIEREDLLALIRALGFSDIQIGHDEPAHLYGPSFSVFASRGSRDVPKVDESVAMLDSTGA
jgi:hypothetical protein